MTTKAGFLAMVIEAAHNRTRKLNGATSAPPAQHSHHLDPATRMKAAAEVLRQSAQRARAAKQLANRRDGQ